MLGEETRDSWILTGPIASQCHNASLCKRLARRIGADRNALIDLADQAPVGGEVDEHWRACCAQLSQTRLAERLVPRMALDVIRRVCGRSLRDSNRNQGDQRERGRDECWPSDDPAALAQAEPSQRYGEQRRNDQA